MIFRFLSIFTLASFLGFSSQAAFSSHTQNGFLPENNLNISINFLSTGGITEAQFNEIIDRLERLFMNDVRAQGDDILQTGVSYRF